MSNCSKIINHNNWKDNLNICSINRSRIIGDIRNRLKIGSITIFIGIRIYSPERKDIHLIIWMRRKCWRSRNGGIIIIFLGMMLLSLLTIAYLHIRLFSIPQTLISTLKYSSPELNNLTLNSTLQKPHISNKIPSNPVNPNPHKPPSIHPKIQYK